LDPNFGHPVLLRIPPSDSDRISSNLGIHDKCSPVSFLPCSYSPSPFTSVHVPLPPDCILHSNCTCITFPQLLDTSSDGFPLHHSFLSASRSLAIPFGLLHVALPVCDAFARLGRSPCFHFEPLGLSRCTAKSCVALCLFFVLCSSSIPYVPLPFSCLPSCSRTFHNMHSHRTLFHLELYLHSPAACHSQCRLRTTTICQPVAVSTSPHASYHFHASFPCLLFSRCSWTFPVCMTPS
jgi:hypothetical protein